MQTANRQTTMRYKRRRRSYYIWWWFNKFWRGPDHGDSRLVLGLVVVERRDAVAWLNPSVFGHEDVLVAVGEFGDGGAEGHVWMRGLR